MVAPYWLPRHLSHRQLLPPPVFRQLFLFLYRDKPPGTVLFTPTSHQLAQHAVSGLWAAQPGAHTDMRTCKLNTVTPMTSSQLLQPLPNDVTVPEDGPHLITAFIWHQLFHFLRVVMNHLHVSERSTCLRLQAECLAPDLAANSPPVS